MDNTIYDSARKHYLGGDRLAAIRILECAIEANNDDGHAWELLGVIRHGDRDIESALNALEKATTLKVLTLGGQLATASCYMKLDFPLSAKAIFVHLSNQNLPTRYLPDVILGLAELEEFERALRLSRVASKRDPFCDRALYAVAHYMGKCGYPVHTILPVMHKVVDLAPEIVRYQVSLATLYIKDGNDGVALHVLTLLSPKQLSTIGCAECLQRIAELFDGAGDDVRRDACLRRIDEIKLT